MNYHHLSFLNLGEPEVLVILFVVLPVILFFSALVQAMTATFANPNDKLLWILLILFVPMIGPVLWFLVGKKKIVGTG